jgi:hypothetical protein
VKIEFSEGAKGQSEIESVLRIARSLPETAGSLRLREQLENSAFSYLQDDEAEATRMRSLIASNRPSWLARAAASWHRLWGPTSREMDLSKQRIDALERAERAERSSFDAVAEMARIGRERDALSAGLLQLRQRNGESDSDVGE